MTLSYVRENQENRVLWISEQDSNVYYYTDTCVNSLWHSQGANENQVEDDKDSEAFSLSMLMTDLPLEAEKELRQFLSMKLTKGSVYSDTGCIAPIEFKKGDEPVEFACYFCQDDKASERYLSHWPYETMEYLCRCLSLVQQDVKYLLYCALVDGKLAIEGGTEQNKRDITRFTKTCNLSDILRQMDHEGKDAGSTASSVDMLLDLTDDTSRKVISLKISDSDVKFSCEGCTKFCEDWGKLLHTANIRDPGQIRQIIEAGKVKYIQSINTLKRLLMQAENDYYALYSGSGEEVENVEKFTTDDDGRHAMTIAHFEPMAQVS
ncbi:hypothetical protein FSP39_016017 [Pinctada imbricata]|uniref:Uncharacterized protein n=1 Tax=Pinctada imbricata TaxID=66713 RepID=A0AA88XZ81_PINIB|nr:hypothetical protein FSP39_016017 [Pinctada imbricata]